MKTLICVFLLAVCALAVTVDTDITGKWSGSFNITNPGGETKNDTAYLVLKQNGSEITGTVGPNEDEQFPITKGSIADGKITIEADHEGHTIKLDLTLAGERITGDANMSGGDGQNAKAKLDVTRRK